MPNSTQFSSYYLSAFYEKPLIFQSYKNVNRTRKVCKKYTVTINPYLIYILKCSQKKITLKRKLFFFHCIISYVIRKKFKAFIKPLEQDFIISYVTNLVY